MFLSIVYKLSKMKVNIYSVNHSNTPAEISKYCLPILQPKVCKDSINYTLTNLCLQNGEGKSGHWRGFRGGEKEILS